MSARVAIIGAGAGGLSAAIRLAAAGVRTIVLEQNDAVGGKMHELRAACSRDVCPDGTPRRAASGAAETPERPQAAPPIAPASDVGGFRWDAGPSVITMRPVLEDLFATAGRRLEEALTLLPVEPLTRYFFPDGVRLDATRDWPRLAEQIQRIDERDVAGYASYLAHAARIHRTTAPHFIFGRRPSLASLLKVPVRDALALEPWLRMDASIRRRVRSPHLRQFFGRFATYVGSSPYEAPAVLGAISHAELTQGVWHPQGGVFGIARALARLAEELGVEVRTGCRVEQVVVENGRARGVLTADGERVAADAVLANVDVTTLYAQLLPAGAAPASRLRRLADARLSCSGFTLLLGVRGRREELAHHNIFFSEDYRREFADIFERGVPPQRPTLYVSITCKTDPEDAPPGCENWTILANAPALGPAYDWKTGAAAYRDLVLDQLASFGLDIGSRIVAERTVTPADLDARTGSWRGALYGRRIDSPWVVFRRPGSRAADVRGLYLAGGTVHPGGGVPMVMLSGQHAADAILEDAL